MVAAQLEAACMAGGRVWNMHSSVYNVSPLERSRDSGGNREKKNFINKNQLCARSDPMVSLKRSTTLAQRAFVFLLRVDVLSTNRWHFDTECKCAAQRSATWD